MVGFDLINCERKYSLRIFRYYTQNTVSNITCDTKKGLKIFSASGQEKRGDTNTISHTLIITCYNSLIFKSLVIYIVLNIKEIK